MLYNIFFVDKLSQVDLDLFFKTKITYHFCLLCTCMWSTKTNTNCHNALYTLINSTSSNVTVHASRY